MKREKNKTNATDLFKDIKIDMQKSDSEIKAQMYKAIQAKDYKKLKHDKQS